MATLDDLVASVRLKMRDHPKLFQVDVEGDGLATVFDLPVVMVERNGLRVIVQKATPQYLTIDTDYQLDARNGQIRLLVNAPQPGELLFVDGQHYTWFVDDDIKAHAGWVIQSLESDTSAGFVFANVGTGDPRFELTARLTLVEGLWALLTEASLDIDVANPEGINLPVSQRYRQLFDMLQYWTKQAEDLSSVLNIGLFSIEMFELRRVSMSTGRLVPVYKAQEFDDQATPQRLFPPIGDGTL
jgi:hypothetical protein